MEDLSPEELLGDMFWDGHFGPENPSAPPTNQGGGTENAILCRNASTNATTARELESNRCFRHMMSERMRREREKKGYSALHSLLPPDTKNDKKSITLMAAKRIQELKRDKDVLQKENRELQERLAGAMGSGNVGSTKIKIKVNNPTCGLDSMLEALKCLKRLGLKTTSIQSEFSDQELKAVFDIQTQQIEAAEIEEVIKRTLEDAERKLP